MQRPDKTRNLLEEIPPNPFPGAVYQQSDSEDTISWTNKDLPKDPRLYLKHSLWLIALLPIGTLLTIRLVRDILQLMRYPGANSGLMIAGLIVVGCWIGIAVTLYAFIQLSWTESVTINDDHIKLEKRGFLSSSPQIYPIGEVWKLSFERYKYNQDQEFRYTVNLFHKKREKIGYWLSTGEARTLYHLICSILHRRGLDELIQTVMLDDTA